MLGFLEYVEQRENLRQLKTDVDNQIRALNDKAKPILLGLPDFKYKCALGTWQVQRVEMGTLNRDALIACLLANGVTAEVVKKSIEQATIITSVEKVVWVAAREKK